MFTAHQTPYQRWMLRFLDVSCSWRTAARTTNFGCALFCGQNIPVDMLQGRFVDGRDGLGISRAPLACMLEHY
jgi:hypothetical protein